MQVRKLEEHQASLELERSKLMRRAAYAEEQCDELQRYIDVNLVPLQLFAARSLTDVLTCAPVWSLCSHQSKWLFWFDTCVDREMKKRFLAK